MVIRTSSFSSTTATAVAMGVATLLSLSFLDLTATVRLRRITATMSLSFRDCYCFLLLPLCLFNLLRPIHISPQNLWNNDTSIFLLIGLDECSEGSRGGKT